MKIIILEIFGRGGITHYTYNLINALAKNDVEIHLVTSAQYELQAILKNPKIHLHPRFYHISDFISKKWALTNDSKVRLLLKVMDYILATPWFIMFYFKTKPHVVHIQGGKPLILVTLLTLKLLYSPHIVYTAHDVKPLMYMRLSNYLDKWVYCLSNHVIVHCKEDKEILLKYKRESKISIIPHGDYLFFYRQQTESKQEIRQRLGLRTDDYVLLCFGFFSHYKGLDIAIRALPMVHKMLPNVRLLAVGDPVKITPKILEEYRQLACEVGISDFFHLIPGYVPMEEVAPFFIASDCVVLPYRQISQSGVLHLAFAFNLPVIATRIGAFPEIIRDGETGIIVSPENPQELAQALINQLKPLPLVVVRKRVIPVKSV